MNPRESLETWQQRWAARKGIILRAPAERPASTVAAYVNDLTCNLFEPLSARSRRQFIDGAGGELHPPDGLSGNMFAVYSSSALCVNVFHYWSRLLHEGRNQERTSTIEPLLAACGLPARAARSIDFEVPNAVNRRFKTSPHLDVQISFEGGAWQPLGVEAKFCEPYGKSRPGGLNPCYLREAGLWDGWPNVRGLAESISPKDTTHSSLDAAQLLRHLLGLRRQHENRFALLYLWFEVPRTQEALRHRQEVERFAALLNRDGITFSSRTYNQVLRELRDAGGTPDRPYVAYLLERYLEGSPELLNPSWQ
jgi:hypothetical protein